MGVERAQLIDGEQTLHAISQSSKASNSGLTP